MSSLSENSEEMKVSAVPEDDFPYELLGRPVAYHVSYARIAGSVAAGLMLSQAVYWSQRTSNPEGWFYKTQAEWEEETGMTRSEQERARKALVAVGVLEERRAGVPAKLHYRVRTRRLQELLTGRGDDVTLESTLRIFGQTLKGLSRAGFLRATKLGAEAEYVDYRDVLKRDGMTCHICGKAITRGPGSRAGHLTFDHAIALTDGGAHHADNIHPAHADCNFRKGDGTPVDPQTSPSAADKPVRRATTNKSAVPRQTNTETTQRALIENTPDGEAGRATTEPTDPAGEPELKPLDLVEAFNRVSGQAMPVNRGKAFGSAKKLLGAGVTVAEVEGCTRWIMAQDWARERGFDFGTLVNQIDRWRNVGGAQSQHRVDKPRQIRDEAPTFDPVAFLEREHMGFSEEQKARMAAGESWEDVIEPDQREYLDRELRNRRLRVDMVRSNPNYV